MLPKDISQLQVSGLVGLGVVYWGMAAYTIRYAGQSLFANDLRRFTTFMGSVPVLYTAMRVSEGLLDVSPRHRLTSTAIMSASALFLDGTAYMWFPALYENPTLQQKNPSEAVIVSRMGAAWILWGVGAGLAVALLTQ